MLFAHARERNHPNRSICVSAIESSQLIHNVLANIARKYLKLVIKQILPYWELSIAAKQTNILLGKRLPWREHLHIRQREQTYHRTVLILKTVHSVEMLWVGGIW
jgi:hypothetical protein